MKLCLVLCYIKILNLEDGMYDGLIFRNYFHVYNISLINILYETKQDKEYFVSSKVVPWNSESWKVTS